MFFHETTPRAVSATALQAKSDRSAGFTGETTPLAVRPTDEHAMSDTSVKDRDIPRQSHDDWRRDPNLDWSRKPFAQGAERRPRMTWADAAPEQPASATAQDPLPGDADQNLTNEHKRDEGVIITECRDAALVMTKTDVDAGPGSNQGNTANCSRGLRPRRRGLPASKRPATNQDGPRSTF